MDNWVDYVYKLLPDYKLNAEKPVSDPNVHKDVFFNEKILQELVGTSIQLFQNHQSKK